MTGLEPGNPFEVSWGNQFYVLAKIATTITNNFHQSVESRAESLGKTGEDHKKAGVEKSIKNMW